MGKSLKNVVTPDEMCDDATAPTRFRLYEMSMGPLDVSRPWATKDVVGAHRFLQRLWRNLVDEETGELRVTDAEPDEDDAAGAAQGHRRRPRGLRGDALQHRGREADRAEQPPDQGYAAVGTPRSVAEPLVLMLAPLCPARRRGAVVRGWATPSRWPTVRSRSPTSATWSRTPSSTRSRSTARSKARVTVAADADQEQVKAVALADDKVAELLGGKEPRKVIVVPGRLVNIVA